MTTIAAPAAADDVGRAGHSRRESLDRRRLRDVERLAGGDAPGLVDEPDRRARRRGARATCASAPPSSPAPMMATSQHCVRYCNGAMHDHLSGKGRASSPAARAASASRLRARSSPRACNVAVTGRSEAHLSAARPQIEARRPGRGRDAAGRRPPLRRRRARDRRDGRALRRPRHPRQQRRHRHLRRRRRHDARRSGPRSSTRTSPASSTRATRRCRTCARAAAASSSTSAAWPARTRSRTAPRTARRRPG